MINMTDVLDLQQLSDYDIDEETALDSYKWASGFSIGC